MRFNRCSGRYFQGTCNKYSFFKPSQISSVKLKSRSEHKNNFKLDNPLSRSPKFHTNFVVKTPNVRYKKAFVARHITTVHDITKHHNRIDMKHKAFLLIYLIMLMLLIYIAQANYQICEKEKEFKKVFTKRLSLLIEGKIDEFIIAIIDIAKENKEIKECIMKLESGNLKESLKTLDQIFYNSIRIPDAYNLVKGILLNASGNYNLSLDYLRLASNGKSEYIKRMAICHLVMALRYCGNIYVAEQYIIVNDISDAELNKCETVYENLSTLISKFPYRFKRSQSPIGKFISKTSQANDDLFSELKNIESNYFLEHEGNVTIRVWLPDNHSTVGHASLETDKHYISYWPSTPKIGSNNIVNDLLTDIIYGWDATHKTLWQDIEIEKKLPDVRISINLDTNSINEAYEQFVTAGYKWSMLGNIFKDSQNCSGLVLSLLNEGDIDRLVCFKCLFHAESKVPTAINATNTVLDLMDIVSIPLYVAVPQLQLLHAPTTILRHTLGTVGTHFYIRTVTPENINRIATQAFISEYYDNTHSQTNTQNNPNEEKKLYRK